MLAAIANRRARPLKVCLVVPYDLSPEGGGVKQHAIHLTAALRRLGDDVTIIGPSSRPIEDPDIRGFRGVINVPSNGSDNMLGIFVSPRKVFRFFRERSFNVIHFHEPHSPSISYWASWATLRTPHVATFHAYAESNSALLARKLSGKTIFPWIQRGIAVSPAAARYASGAWNRQLTIIPNGVPTKIFTPTAHAQRPAGPLRLLFVGRLGDTRKGARYMLEAFARLRAKGCDATLDVIGELGNFGAVPEIPGLTYWGEVGLDQLAQAYRRSDVLVAPSTGQESFGIILLEAMASGKAVVCSDIDGYRGVIGPEGARFVTPSCADALERGLADIVALGPEARQAMGSANLRAAAEFDWDNIVHRVRDEYLHAMAAVSY